MEKKERGYKEFDRREIWEYGINWWHKILSHRGLGSCAALVLPDVKEPVYRIYSEGSSMEVAQEIADIYVNKINKIAGLSKNI